MPEKTGSQKSHRCVTVEGRTVKEALEKGLCILGVSRKKVTVHVLAEENRGLFGMRGARPAKVRVSLKPEDAESHRYL